MAYEVTRGCPECREALMRGLDCYLVRILKEMRDGESIRIPHDMFVPMHREAHALVAADRLRDACDL